MGTAYRRVRDGGEWCSEWRSGPLTHDKIGLVGRACRELSPCTGPKPISTGAYFGHDDWWRQEFRISFRGSIARLDLAFEHGQLLDENGRLYGVQAAVPSDMLKRVGGLGLTVASQ